MTMPYPSPDAQTLQTVVKRVGGIVGLHADEARLIKFTNNAVFALDSEQVVVRIAGSAPIAALVDTTIAAARWFAEHDLPTIRLWEHAPQPLTVDGFAVTVWHQVPAHHGEATGAQLGDFLKQLHALGTAPREVQPWRQLDATRARILAGRHHLAGGQVETLLAMADELARELTKVRYMLQPGPIFGDAQIGNLIAGPDGPVMADFDSVAVGPREWDLIPAAVAQARFAFPVDHYGQLAETYGVDITAWEHYDTFRRLRVLQLLGSVLPIISTSARIRDQWEYRYSTIDEPDATWEIFET
jgi:hypothetical protein